MQISSELLLNKDLQHLWHPHAQMKDYETFKPLIVKRASGSYIELSDGHSVIDAISSWWCKSLGHNHPRLKQALLKQVDKFEHVILANTTNETIIELSEKLATLTNSLNKVIYAGDGSCGVEIALKMSIHARQILGQEKRKLFVSLSNAYHGDTIGALSVGDVDKYCNPYQSLLFESKKINNIPYVSGKEDPLWENCEKDWKKIEKELAPLRNQITAVIVEPIVQGAGNMRIYSQDFLQRLRVWTKENQIHLIADEIMTGIGRTGKMLACEHARIEPDLLCLGKGLTSGWLPFTAVLLRDDIYDLFYGEYGDDKSFLHSHTYSGNALAAAVALETLHVMEQSQINDAVSKLEPIMRQMMEEIAQETGRLTQVRNIGAIVAADLICDPQDKKAGYRVFQQATRLGAFLRPIGNTLYWLPPLNITIDTLSDLKAITQEAIITTIF